MKKKVKTTNVVARREQEANKLATKRDENKAAMLMQCPPKIEIEFDPTRAVLDPLQPEEKPDAEFFYMVTALVATQMKWSIPESRAFVAKTLKEAGY
jgi:hypothetical protein